jgi:hypothetical protein
MPFDLKDLNYDKDSKERLPWEHYLEQYQKADPQEISRRLSLDYQEETGFTFSFLGTVYHVTWPDFTVCHEEDAIGYYPLEEMHAAKILAIRYLLSAAPGIPGGTFKTYREMPWGDVYLRQFNGRCIMRLAYSYGNRLEKFSQICEKLQGRKMKFGDCAYEFTLFKDLYVQFILWEGDDEFPPSSQILFSDNFPTAFEAEDMAVTGDILIGTLKAVEKILD